MKILASDPISESAVEELKKLGTLVQGHEALETDLADAEILIVRSRTKVTKELMDKAPKLKAIIRAGVGLDNIDLEHARSKNIQVLNTPQAPSIAVAELALGLILSMLRGIPKADASMKAGEWLKKELKGRELHDKKLGIIGFGRIGSIVGKLASTLEAEVLVCDPHVEQEQLDSIGAKRVELDELLKSSDIITLHVPLTEQTRGMIGKEQLALMKANAYLVNTARGPVIDEDALYEALKSGKLAGVAMDVYWTEPPFDSRIMEFKHKLVLTPHIGGATYEAQERIGELIVELVKSLQE